MSTLKRSINDLISFTLLLIIIALCYRVLKQKQAEKLALENFQLERWSCASQMTASIAHEIRNPLTSIKGFIQLIMRKPDRPAPRSYLEIIASEIERIEKLVTEFQLLSRPIKPAEFVSVDIVMIMRDVVMLMESQALNKKVKLNLEYQFDDKLPVLYYVRGDQAQLKQVLINLLRNAIEAVDEQGHIEVTLTQCSGMIAIKIKDDGVGIPQEVLLKLGTPFYTTKPNGTGLGLSVCFNILESHGGKMEIKSKVGAGTTFTVLLPYLPADTSLET
jgi:signal transduction histidine kinase